MKTGDRQRLKLMHFLEAFCNHIENMENMENRTKKKQKKKN